jgi:transposase
MSDKTIVGVDVSKAWLDLCVADRSERIENTLEAVSAWLARVKPDLVGYEPTGGYERHLVSGLRRHGILFVRVHPNTVIAFRKSRGIKAKTDKIDARLIRDYVGDVLLRGGRHSTILGDERLQALVARRRQLADTLQAEQCRYQLATEPVVRDSLDTVIAVLKQGLDRLDEEIAAAVRANEDHAALCALLQTVCGIGPKGAPGLTAGVPELGLVSNKEISSLVGVAPHTHQSGKSRAHEATGHGRPDVRRILFNAARAAIRHPSPFKTFYDRLVQQNGRPGKVALVAVMRKILVTANAVARDRKPWNGAPQPEPSADHVGTLCRHHAEQTAHRAGRVKAGRLRPPRTARLGLEAA